MNNMLEKIALLSILAVSSAGALSPNSRIKGLRDGTIVSADTNEDRQLKDKTESSPNYPHYSPVYPAAPAPHDIPTSPTNVPKLDPTAAPVIEQPIVMSPAYYLPVGEKRRDFEEECTEHLLSSYYTADELISQHEFAGFLTYYCIKDDACHKDEVLQFDLLPRALRLAFVDPLCEGIPLCLIEAEPEFGYKYTSSTSKQVTRQITNMCESIYPILGDYVATTLAPTAVFQPIPPVGFSPNYPTMTEPTDSPTNSPTDSPTTLSPVSPAPILTESPTPAPESPVFSPVEPPSDVPTTLSPVSPAPILTESPTPAPEAPVFSPVEPPSDVPTTLSPVSPAPILTESPTSAPEAPVFSPVEPTLSPVAPVVAPIAPTPSPEMPVFSPTQPTVAPVSPTIQPTDSTAAPVFTPSQPTLAPVFSPTQRTDSPEAPAYSPNYASVQPIVVPSTAPVVSIAPVEFRPSLITSSPVLLSRVPTQSLQPSPSSETTPPTFEPTLLSENPTTAFTANPTAGPVTVAPITSAPSSVPSGAPSETAISVFINEIGTTGGIGFVEIAYSSFLGSDIGLYSLYLYDSAGNLLEAGSLREGRNSINGFTFTVALFPNTTDTAEGFALVKESVQEVLYFLSTGDVITAVNGPAAGTDSIALGAPRIAAIEDQTRYLQAADNQTEDDSVSLVGNGCDYDDFVFGETESTPGTINVGQQIGDCTDPVTLAPSAAPSFQILNNDQISAGAIAGIAVSSSILILVLLYLLSPRRRRDIDSEAADRENSLTFEPRKAEMDIEAGDEFMADTGDSLFGDGPDLANIPGMNEDTATEDLQSKTPGSWWNSVFWNQGGGTAKVPPSDEEPLDTAVAEKNVGVDLGGTGLDAGATAAASASKSKNRRSWFGRRSKDSAEADEIPEIASRSVGDLPDEVADDSGSKSTSIVSSQPGTKKRKKSRKTYSAAAKASAIAGNAASIALSRKDDDEEVDIKAMPAADVTSEALENLDAALDKHDWNAIYNIADTISRTDSPRTTKSRRNLLGFVAGGRSSSRAAAAAAAMPSDSESDTGGSAMGDSDTSGSRGILGAIRWKGSSRGSQSEVSGVSQYGASKAGSAIMAETPEEGDASASIPAAQDAEKKPGWSGFFKRKSARKSQGSSSSLLVGDISAKALDAEGEGDTNISDTEMQATQQQFRPIVTPSEDALSPSIGTGYVPGDVSVQPASRSSEDTVSASIGTGYLTTDDNRLDTSSETQKSRSKAEEDRPGADNVTKSSNLAQKQSELVDSIQKISQDLETDTQVKKGNPSLSGAAPEEEIGRLIEKKDWKALGDFADREQIYNNAERKTIEARGEKVGSEAEKLARDTVKKEFEDAMMTLRATETKEGTSFIPNQDVPDDASAASLIQYWNTKDAKVKSSSESSDGKP